MGDLLLKRATVTGGKIERLVIGIDRLPDRTVDRATAIRWMRDGHSLVPLVEGRRLPALQLVEVPTDAFAIRTDNEPVDEDRLPTLPPA
jgi:hypothetical protein